MREIVRMGTKLELFLSSLENNVVIIIALWVGVLCLGVKIFFFIIIFFKIKNVCVVGQ